MVITCIFISAYFLCHCKGFVSIILLLQPPASMSYSLDGIILVGEPYGYSRHLLTEPLYGLRPHVICSDLLASILGGIAAVLRQQSKRSSAALPTRGSAT